MVGECSASYLSAPGVADRIVAAYPTTKLFVIVRHPLERAIAVYESAKKTGRIAANVSCAQYLVDHETVQSDGFYGQHLHDFFTYYTSLQLHMIVYEDFVENPLKVIQDLFGFLEVDTQFIPKALAAYAPPPDEPKHRSRLSRLIHWCATRLKALTAKPTVPVTPPPYQLTQYFSPAELAAFSKALQPDCAHLTNVMHRDMGVFWNITDAGRE